MNGGAGTSSKHDTDSGLSVCAHGMGGQAGACGGVCGLWKGQHGPRATSKERGRVHVCVSLRLHTRRVTRPG